MNLRSDSSGGDGYVAKFSPTGARFWSTYIGGDGDEGAAGVTTDANGNIAVAGFTNSSSGISSYGAHKIALEGIDDAFLIKFNSSGTRLWATYCGGPNTDEANAVGCDSAGHIFLVGLTNSSSGIASATANQNVYGGGAYDVLIAAFTPAGGLFTISNNTITGMQQICPKASPLPLSGSVIHGGYSIRQYKWLQSETGPDIGFVPAILPRDSINYQPSKITINTWYRRVVLSGEFSDTSEAIMIKVNQNPVAGFTINSQQQCLMGNTFKFTDTSNITGGLSMRAWDAGDGFKDSTAIINKSYAFKGHYIIRLKVIDNNNCTDSVSKNITVEPNPVMPVITAIATNVLQSSTAFAYHWYLNNVLISDSNRQQLNIKTKGVYKVVADSINGCSNTSANYIITTTDILENIKNYRYTVYPNPSEGILYLGSKNNLPVEHAEIEIWDAKGLLILKQECIFYKGEHIKIDLSDFKQGLYIVRINKEAFKIIKN